VSDRGLVFIIDHAVSNSDTLQALLEKDGYAVAKTAHGKDAREGIAAAEPNLVLLDVHLPDINPFELFDELKKSHHGRDIPVIFAVGDVRHGVVRRVASAVGQGSVTVNFVHKYLETV
jgi:CheY-like chemotaxis protein